MSEKKKQPKKPDQLQDIQSDFVGDVKLLSIERTLEELLFLNVDYKDVEKLRKLRRINRRKHIDIIKKIKDCLNDAI